MSLYSEKFLRNPLTRAQQQKIRASRFAIVGLGGTGGFILENLLRMGAENLIVFDHDRFELSNFNRQMLATQDTLDQPKAKAARRRAGMINPDANLAAEGRFDGNTEADADMLIDGSDNVGTKLAMARLARKKRIPFVFCSAGASRGIVTVFRKYRFEKAFQLGAHGRYRPCQSILCPAASVAGALAASQAANLVIGKPYVRAPEALFFDLFKERVFWRAGLG
jgi:molybdopterin/thiamine biosynthesis adenylyltransferase